MDILQENSLDDFSVSNITQKALDTRFSEGNTGVKLQQVQLNYPDRLYLNFEVDSTYDGNQNFGPSGQSYSANNNNYEVEIEFHSLSRWLPNNFSNMPYSQQAQLLKDLFDNDDDVTVSCSCPAFYWQGMSHDLSKQPKPNSAMHPFAGPADTGVWHARHGGDNNRVCKHLAQIIDSIDNYIKPILKQLGSGQVVQQQPLDQPDQTAGQPTQKNIQTKKVEVEEQLVEEVKPTNEMTDKEINQDSTITKEEKLGKPPTGDITQVKPKKINPKTEASEGISTIEPAIQEPEKSTGAENHSQEMDDKIDDELEEPLDPLHESYRSNDAVYQILKETYRNPDINWIQRFIKNLQDGLFQYDNSIKDNIKALKQEKGIEFIIDDTSINKGKESIISAYFDGTYIKIIVSLSFFQNIKDNENIDEIIERLEYVYLHEEIHVQQKEKSKGLAKKDIQNDIINKLDIDAYARETAHLLQKEYTSDIIKRKLSSIEGIFELNRFLVNKGQQSVSLLGLYYFRKRSLNQKKEWYRFVNKLIQFIDNKYEKLFEKIYSDLYHNSRFENDELNAGKRKKSFNKDANVQGIWASDDEKTSQTYGRHQLELDMELDNPLVVDFCENHAHGLPEEEQKRVYDDTLISRRKSLETTDDIVKAAADSEDDFDGVIMKNVYDGGPYGRVEDSANLYVALDRDQVKVKNKKFIESQKNSVIKVLREELFYRGYRNDSLFQGSGLLPNESSKVLFVAPDADHAYQFAVGQTTRGDKMVFEVYDIPVKQLKIYNLQEDAEKVREASLTNGGTGIQYFDQDFMVNLLKQKGYNAWTKIDGTVLEDEDDMPGWGRQLSKTWELAIFDKDKYKPIDRIVSDDNGDFTDEQLEYMINKYDLPFFDNLLDSSKYAKQFDDAYGNEMADQETYYKQIEDENKKREDQLSKSRDAQDSNQLDMFSDNSPTKRQILRKRITHIAKTLDGYERDGYQFEEMWKDLSEQGYSDDEIRVANMNVVGEIIPDISEGWSKTEWIKFDKVLTDFLNKREDNEYDRLHEKLISTKDIDEFSKATDLSNRLEKIESDSDWGFVGAGVNASAGLRRLKGWSDESWLIVDNNDEPVGVVGIQTNELRYNRELGESLHRVGLKLLDKPYVHEISLLAFKKNTITLVKDVIKLINELKKKYYFVRWSVSDDNPAKEMYDRYLPKLNGKFLNGSNWFADGKTYYIISKSFDKKKMNESLADDNFHQIYDDLTDAHGYLVGPSDETGNNAIYMELGDAIESIKNVFDYIYTQNNQTEKLTEIFGKKKKFSDDKEKGHKFSSKDEMIMCNRLLAPKESQMISEYSLLANPGFYVKIPNSDSVGESIIIHKPYSKDILLYNFGHFVYPGHTKKIIDFLKNEWALDILGDKRFHCATKEEVVDSHPNIESSLISPSKFLSPKFTWYCIPLDDLDPENMVAIDEAIEKFNLETDSSIKRSLCPLSPIFFKNKGVFTTEIRETPMRLNPAFRTSNADDRELYNSQLELENELHKTNDELRLLESKSKSKQYIGCCKDIGLEGNLPWSDATELAGDLGYYATFDSMEDPDDSNFEEISGKEFYRVCDPVKTNPDAENVMSNEIGLFIKSKDDDIYCFYSDEYDTHYFWR